MNKYITIITAIFLFMGCGSKENIGEFALDEHFDKNLEKVASRRIYFGHQSVGNNIVEGLQEILTENPNLKLNVLESADDLPDSGGFFLHTRIGENTQPNLKCDDFIQQLNPELVSQLDVAMFKFCYIDINRDSDVHALFDYYKNTISDVREKYPELTVIHVTAPVRHSPNDFKTKIRELIGGIMGKPNNSKLDNAKRNEFNALQKGHYAGEPIFDLAKSEATYPDGRENIFKMNGRINYNLIGSYTYDGGHLNEIGRKKVATDLIAFLASL